MSSAEASLIPQISEYFDKEIKANLSKSFVKIIYINLKYYKCYLKRF